MTGFAGYLSKDGGSVGKMLEAVCPTDVISTKEYINQNCAIATAQLSKHFAPSEMVYESAKGFAIAFNGRVYNYEDLKSEFSLAPISSDDAELVLLGFINNGADFVRKIKGMFAFAVYNEEKGSVSIVRDGCGMRSVYYAVYGDGFAFASGTRGFEHLVGFKKEFNQKLLSAFLCYGSVPSKETFFKDVYRLEPGHILTFENGIPQKECFFRLEFNQQNKAEEEFIEEIHQSVCESIGYHCQGNYASFLSSGVDSSYIASVAKPETVYTAGYASNKYDESLYTKELAEALGIENKVKIITPEEYVDAFEDIVYAMDEPLSNPSVPSIYFGMEAVANDGKESIISGEGADELFGGYNSYKEETRHGGYMKLPYFIRHFIYLVTKWIPSPKLDFFARRGQRLKDYHIGLDRVFKDRDALAVIKEKKCVPTKEITAEYYEEYKDQSTMKQRQAIDFYFWLINDFVHCVAKSADRFGIESRFPLLGSEVVNIAVQLPDEFKLKDGMTKALFRKAARKAIPTDAHSRKKLGFPVPLKDWIKRDDFYEKIKARFQSETANKFFDTRAILKLLDDHKKGEKDCYKKVWTIYTFLVWYDLNFNA